MREQSQAIIDAHARYAEANAAYRRHLASVGPGPKPDDWHTTLTILASQLALARVAREAADSQAYQVAAWALGLERTVTGLAERVAAQSDLLSRRAEGE